MKIVAVVFCNGVFNGVYEGCCKFDVSLSSVGLTVAGCLSVMGFLSWFCVVLKAFELSVVEGASVLCLVERSQDFLWVGWVISSNFTW